MIKVCKTAEGITDEEYEEILKKEELAHQEQL